MHAYEKPLLHKSTCKVLLCTRLLCFLLSEWVAIQFSARTTHTISGLISINAVVPLVELLITYTPLPLLCLQSRAYFGDYNRSCSGQD